MPNIPLTFSNGITHPCADTSPLKNYERVWRTFASPLCDKEVCGKSFAHVRGGGERSLKKKQVE